MIAQRVASDYDQGVVVASAQVQIWKDDTVDSLQANSLPIEHQVQIELLSRLAREDVTEASYYPFARTPAEILILETAKAAAKTLYPHG
jgi:folate-dependent phosphoribosylglycinamide formyltransferase PurN